MKTIIAALALSGGLFIGVRVTEAQSCRANFGGIYVFAGSGVKPSGNAFSAIAYFFVNAATFTFDVQAGINERNVGVFFPSDTERPWGWTGPCQVFWDRAAFVGVVSADGNFISFVTFDDTEQMAGIAIRQ